MASCVRMSSKFVKILMFSVIFNYSSLWFFKKYMSMHVRSVHTSVHVDTNGDTLFMYEILKKKARNDHKKLLRISKDQEWKAISMCYS